MEKARFDLMTKSEELHLKQFRIDNLERTVAQLKSELAAQETSLQETLDAIKNPVKMGTSKEVQDKLTEGAIAIRQVKSLQQQFQEWKTRYQNVVPASIRDEKIAAKKELIATQLELKGKEHEAIELEEVVIATKSLWSRVYMAGIAAPTLYKIFVYEYTQIKLGVAPYTLWPETSKAGRWKELWLVIPNRERNVLAIGWKLGWEEVINYKTPVPLGGSMPL